MTTKELDDSLGRDTTMCGDPKAWFPMRVTCQREMKVKAELDRLGIENFFANDVFDIRKIHFLDKMIDKDEIDSIVFQIEKGYCDNLFYQDPDSYFAANYTLFAMRNAGKKYVKEILSKMVINPETKQFKEPMNDLSQIFSLGEFKAIQVLRELVRDQMYFDENGLPIKEKLDTLIKDIDMGLWDSYLMWNYEAYQSVMMQIQMGQVIAGLRRGR